LETGERRIKNPGTQTAHEELPKGGNNMNQEQKDAIRKQELEKLDRIFRDLSPDKKNLIENLKHQAAFMVSFMAELQETLDNEGPIDQFEQGKQKFMREHPAAKTYNTMMRNYLATIKQLLALLPPEEAREAKDEFAAFIEKAVK